MSDGEALMWTLEKDPRLSSSVANLTLLDRPPDRERLRARMSMAVDAVPRLRQRVVPALGRLAPPEWRDDPEFDLDRHLRWMALPSGSDERDLCDLAARMAAEPFDRTRPLWEFVVVEGLPGGRAAMVQKLHHTVTDGEGGVRMSAQFLDVERDAEGPLVVVEPGPPPPPPDSLLSTSIDTVTHNLRRGLGIARRAAGDAAGTVLHPERLVHAGTDAAALGRSVGRQLLITDRAHSPLWRDRTLRRRFLTLSVPFAEAKEASARLGGSLNDLFVTAAAGAAGAYHRRAGVEVDELRMAMPISTRARGQTGGNAFTPSRILVPAGIEDPVARFAAIRERVTATRSERALSAVEAMAGIVNLLPTSVLVRMALQQVETVDFTTSNVRGASFDLYMAGAHIEGNHPLGPLGGTAWNLTLLSYAGRLDMGLNVDSGAVDEPEALRDDVLLAFDELLSAKPAGRAAASKRAGAPKKKATEKKATEKKAVKKKAVRKNGDTARPARRTGSGG
jgi:diacylglycerol O-acyltransferase / wax synthase